MRPVACSTKLISQIQTSIIRLSAAARRRRNATSFLPSVLSRIDSLQVIDDGQIEHDR